MYRSSQALWKPVVEKGKEKFLKYIIPIYNKYYTGNI
jgi:hypothetical protein